MQKFKEPPFPHMGMAVPEILFVILRGLYEDNPLTVYLPFRYIPDYQEKLQFPLR